MASTTQPSNPYAGMAPATYVPYVPPAGPNPYAGMAPATAVQMPHGPVSIPDNAPPGLGERLLRTGLGPFAAADAAIDRTAGGIAGFGAHVAGALASDTGLAAPGGGPRWDAATQRQFAPPAPMTAGEAELRALPGHVLSPLTTPAMAAGNEIERHMPAGVNHVVNDYVAPIANLAASFVAPEAGRAADALPEAYEGTEGAVAKGTNDVARAAELGISPGRAQVAARQGAGGAPGPVARISELTTGKGPYAGSISIRNEPRVNAGVNYDLGIPAGQVTSRQAILDAQTKLKTGMDRMQAVPGTIQMDPMFRDDMNGVGTTLRTLPHPANIDELKTVASAPTQVDAPTLIKTVQEARATGSQLMDSDDPQQVQLGKAYLGTARAYENQFARYLQQNPQLGVSPDEWAQLRQGWAKNQLALTAYKGGETGGSYDAKVFGNAVQAGEPLTGWMRIIGNEQPGASENFKLGQSHPGGAVPYIGSGVGSLVGMSGLLSGHLGMSLGVGGAIAASDAVRAGLRRAVLGPVLTPAQASERAAAIAQDPRMSYFFAARDQGHGFAPQPETPEPQQGSLPLGTPLDLQPSPGATGAGTPVPHTGPTPIGGRQGQFNGMNVEGLPVMSPGSVGPTPSTQPLDQYPLALREQGTLVPPKGNVGAHPQPPMPTKQPDYIGPAFDLKKSPGKAGKAKRPLSDEF